MNPKRLLITGSRMWDDWAVIYYALAAEWTLYGSEVELVSGNCPPRRNGPPGADYICEQTWEAWGGLVKRCPARWAAFGKPAGYRRNAEMAALPGVYKCLAFQLDGSLGTANCIECALSNGIPVSPFIRRAQ